MVLDQREVESQIGIDAAPELLDDSFKSLWEKVQTAAGLIQELRADRRLLRDRIAELEANLGSVRTENQQRDAEFKRLRTEHTQLLNSTGNAGFSGDERESLKAKIRELVSKINSHL